MKLESGDAEMMGGVMMLCAVAAVIAFAAWLYT